MSWFGLLLIFVLFCQSNCEKNETENKAGKHIPQFNVPIGHIMNALRDKSCLSDPSSPLCLLGQQFLPPSQSFALMPSPAVPEDPAVPNNASLAQNGLGIPKGRFVQNDPFILPGQMQECFNCPGPSCYCRPSTYPLSNPSYDSINTQANYIKVICYLNRIGALPQIPITIGCWIAYHKNMIMYILRGIYRVIRNIVRYLPFGNILFPDDMVPQKNPAKNVFPVFPSYLGIPNAPFVSDRSFPFSDQTLLNYLKTSSAQPANTISQAAS